MIPQAQIYIKISIRKFCMRLQYWVNPRNGRSTRTSQPPTPLPAAMFAVPGWSVPSSNLKTQTLPPANTTVNTTSATESQPADLANPSRKRHGSNGKSTTLKVNAANLADLWETVIEGKSREKKSTTAAGKSSNRERKRRKQAHKGEKEGATLHEDHTTAKAEAEDESEPAPKKHKSKHKKGRLQAEPGSVELAAISTVAPQLTSSQPATQLTPLQQAMRQKLISARFRHLNQSLYTTPSTASLQLFADNPEMFREYHEGFRRQVEVWPENPVEGYISQILSRGARRSSSKHGSQPDLRTQESSVQPLPRTDGTAHIADLGCGDAALSLALQPHVKKLHLKIYSFDLQTNSSPLITLADISSLPLAANSIDVAIFCLALMGTNWTDFVEEAFRILRWKGELWVAEIKSRFIRSGTGTKQNRVEHSVGKRVKGNAKEDKKLLKKQEEDSHEADLAVEVDGNEDPKAQGETDVSAFVEVLRKRGFVMQGEPDLKNRMFVRMRFVKGLTPVRGKGVPVAKVAEEPGDGEETWKRKMPKAKFIDKDELPEASEAGVLKPCVYKLR
jgi:ribosomal RNA-processing protein 8